MPHKSECPRYFSPSFTRVSPGFWAENKAQSLEQHRVANDFMQRTRTKGSSLQAREAWTKGRAHEVSEALNTDEEECLLCHRKRKSSLTQVIKKLVTAPEGTFL